VIVKAVGEHVLRQECPVKDEALVAVVMQHDVLQKTLAVLIEKIGLERRTKTISRVSRSRPKK
jgi:hypothetical protein